MALCEGRAEGQRCLGGLGRVWIGVFGVRRWSLGWVEGCGVLGLG